MLAIPAGLALLAVLPAILLVYLVFTSPVPKLLAHVVMLLRGKAVNRRRNYKVSYGRVLVVARIRVSGGIGGWGVGVEGCVPWEEKMNGINERMLIYKAH